jgi:hypothetical protein
MCIKCLNILIHAVQNLTIRLALGEGEMGMINSFFKLMQYGTRLKIRFGSRGRLRRVRLTFFLFFVHLNLKTAQVVKYKTKVVFLSLTYGTLVRIRVY